MKNIFIITLGTREVQFKIEKLQQYGFEIGQKGGLYHPNLEESDVSVYSNDNYPGFYCCSYPRIAGKTILENYELFKPVLEYPLIDHAFREIVKDYPIDNLIFVYTDQQDLDPANIQQQRNLSRDTLYFRDILRLQFGDKTNGIANDLNGDIGITRKTTDIDFQYRDFAIKCRSLFEMEMDVCQVFLLAQGGIDQINHALTLQLIQAFGSKVKLWQQAEGEAPKNLQFPFLFIQDLDKQKLMKHLEDFDFGLIANMRLPENPVLLELAQYAYRRLNLDSSWIPASAHEFHDVDNKGLKIKDLYLNAKISYHKGDFGSYLWKLFTLFENLFRYKCNQILGDTENLYKSGVSENIGWLTTLRNIEGLYNFLLSRRHYGKPLKLDNPNRVTYKHIYNFFCSNKLLDDSQEFINNLNRVYNLAEKLMSERNKIAHYLEPINKPIIEKALDNYSCDQLNQFLDNIFNIKKECPFGVYSKIKEKILSIL